MPLPAEIYSAASVRDIDRTAIDTAGISGYSLMEKAAQAALDEATSRYPEASHWQVVCGSGNNGGDGYVIARLAAVAGITVSVSAASPPESLHGDAATAYADYCASGGYVAPFAGELDLNAELIVDALLGSGLAREVEGPYAELVKAINQHPAKVLALDVPSGLDADSGEVLGCSVIADLTVTFVGLKSGLFLRSGPDYVGELHFSDLGIPQECRATRSAVLRRIRRDDVSRHLPKRTRDSHKGNYGHVLVVGGGPGMPGAVRLCGEAALRTGAGLVTVATHPGHHALIAANRPELMCHAIEEPAALTPLLDRATTVAIGPGLGTDEWSAALFAKVMERELPMVVDADALTLLRDSAVRRSDWILTPHPGEAARLLACSTAAVQDDRLKALASIVQQYGGTVVLKGSGSLVSAGEGANWLCSAGNPGMAAPGMGDVLTGIIAALRAQGLSAEAAATSGVWLHARAGDSAALAGQRGMLASDLLNALRLVVNP